MKCDCTSSTDSSCASLTSCASLIQILIIVASVLLVVGIITCILSYYKMGARSWSDQRNRPQPPARMQLQSPCPHDQQQDHPEQQQQHYTYALAATTTSIMYSQATIQERQRLEAGAYKDRLVQLQSVQTDLILDLPHSILLPDGEEHHHHHHHHSHHAHHCSSKNHKIRDLEHHGEITRSFIRPPPNRTVQEMDPLPPFRSNSVGLLQKPASTPLAQTPEGAPLVMRSHSMSSSTGCTSGRPHKGHLTALVNPNVPLCLPPLVTASHPTCPTNSSGVSVSCNNMNRTFSTKPVADSKFSSTDPPPTAHSNLGTNHCDTNTVNKCNDGV